jgi:hypothetical protein
MDVFKLSRNWFDFCFENPEKISPNHSAIYFFSIEHCNRLGWKQKFGFPSQMAMEAVGIKNWRTFIKAFNDLVSWGFLKLIEKSKNQYSANVIAIAENTKANTKALDKALQKHSQKHYKSIVSIDIQETNKQETIYNSWKTDFEIYKSELREKYQELLNNKEWIEEKQKYHPKLDIELTLEKSCVEFWATEAGWKYKKKSKSDDIDWKRTLTNALDLKQNHVYKNNYKNGTHFEVDKKQEIPIRHEI